MLGKITVWLWLQFLIVLILAVIAQVFARVDKVTLPNGIYLAPTDFDQSRIKLASPDGKTIIPPNVSEVLWCKDYVYGYMEIENIYHEKSGKYFIYKKGWDEASYYKSRDGDFMSYIQKHGFIEPNHMNEQKYRNLVAEEPITNEFCSNDK